MKQTVFMRDGIIFEKSYKEILSKNIDLPCIVEFETGGRLGKFNKIKFSKWIDTPILCKEIYEDPEYNNAPFLVLRDYDDMIVLKEPIEIFNVVAKNRDTGSIVWAWCQVMEAGKTVINPRMHGLFLFKRGNKLTIKNSNEVMLSLAYDNLNHFKETIGNLYPDGWDIL